MTSDETSKDTIHNAVTVGDVFENRGYSTDVFGVEVEVEGYNLPKFLKYWRHIHDGSLKKDEDVCDDPECEDCNNENLLDAAEYVLASPMTQEEVKAAGSYLAGQFEAYGTDLKDSIRAAIHIHMNAAHWPYIEFMNFLTAYYFIEDTLLCMCGPGRRNNQFCLPASSCWGTIRLVQSLNKAVLKPEEMGSPRYLLSEGQYKYSALNLATVPTLGTVEFRAIMTPSDPRSVESSINFWVNLLSILRKKTSKFNNPSEICTLFSSYGHKEFFKRVIGEDIYENYICSLVPDHHDLLINNVRNAQSIAYTNWQDIQESLKRFKPATTKSNTVVENVNLFTVNPFPPTQPGSFFDLNTSFEGMIDEE